MKVKFCHDNGANIHSKKEEIFDTEKDLGLTDDEWNALTEISKHMIVEDWAMQDFDWWYEEDL